MAALQCEQCEQIMRMVNENKDTRLHYILDCSLFYKAEENGTIV